MKAATKIEARKLKGFQDYDPAHMALRFKIMDVVRDEAARAGFMPIGTPAIEYADVLLGVGGETDKQVYRFQDNGERDVALRFDLTLPFARYVAENHGTLPMPFKRLQIGDVWRAEKPQRGRYREFCQCDLDIIGIESLEADVEIILCLQNVVARLLDTDFTMLLGNRFLLSALIRNCFGDINPEQESAALIAIDKLDKIGRPAVTELLIKDLGVNLTQCDKLLDILAKQKNGDLSALANDNDERVTAELARLQETANIVNECMRQSGKKLGKVKIDLSIARGLGYYTGIVFETKIDADPDFGSICSGGRYDHLVERFLNKQFSGIGGSLGLDRLAAYLITNEKLPTLSPTAYIAVVSEAERQLGFTLAQSLRNLGISTEIQLKSQKLAQQFKRANQLGCKYVITLGENERLTQTVSLKNMQSGEETRGISITDVAQMLRS